MKKEKTGALVLQQEGGGHCSNPYIGPYLSQISRERIIQRTGPERSAQCTTTQLSETEHFLLLHCCSRGRWQIHADATVSQSAENEVSWWKFIFLLEIALKKEPQNLFHILSLP